MDIHASPAKLPELDEFVTTFQVRFRRPEGEAALERYLTGLLTDVAHTNCDTLAAAVPGTSEQRLQEFLTNMQWDEEDLNRQRVHKMIAEATSGRGGLIFDDTGFAKQGKHSVGVARQYSGPLGKVGNCQVAVTCCYSDPQATWPVAVRLYLPREWTEEPERCQRARVPAAVTFQTKPQIALTLLDQARAWGVPHRCVVADADYGDNPAFLAGLEARRERYVVAVRTDFASARSGRRRRGGSGRTRYWRRSTGANGVRSAGDKGPRAGCGKSAWRCVPGGSRRRERPTSAGCWGNGLPVGSPRNPNSIGVTCPPRPRWKSWSPTPTAGMRLSNSMRRPKENWGGITTRAACGRASTAIPSR